MSRLVPYTKNDCSEKMCTKCDCALPICNAVMEVRNGC